MRIVSAPGKKIHPHRAGLSFGSLARNNARTCRNHQTKPEYKIFHHRDAEDAERIEKRIVHIRTLWHDPLFGYFAFLRVLFVSVVNFLRPQTCALTNRADPRNL